jgi:hypothetical protein
MKILFRIAVILVVAALVGGAMYALVNVTGAGRRQNSFQRQEGGQLPQNNGGFRPDGGGRGDRGRGNGFGLMFGMLQSLAAISVIAVIYYNATKWFRKARAENKQIEV